VCSRPTRSSPPLYISFASDILNQSEITDYLVRIAAAPPLRGSQASSAREILGARTFAMRIWLKPEVMAALNISPSSSAALAANNYLAAVGTTKGALVQVNLTANTDLHSAAEFKRLVVRQTNDTIVRLEDIADVVLGSEDYDSRVRLSGQTAVFLGIFLLPQANTVDVVKRVRVELEALKKDLPSGSARIGYDASEYIDNAIREGHEHARRDTDHRRHRDLLVPWVRALRAGADPRYPGVADWRRIPDADIWFHDQPPHVARHRALGRSCGR